MSDCGMMILNINVVAIVCAWYVCCLFDTTGAIICRLVLINYLPAYLNAYLSIKWDRGGEGGVGLREME